LEKALKIINELQSEGLIKKYAIGGAFASLFYVDPITTYDLDIMIILEDDSKKLISLSPLYERLLKRGYKPEKEHIIIEGIPIQFIPAYNNLVIEAVNFSVVKKYENTSTFVINPEYQIAIMLDTNRDKDRERISRIIKETEVNLINLEKILSKYNLTDKFKPFKSE